MTDPFETESFVAQVHREMQDAFAEYDYDRDAEEDAAAKHMCVVLPRYNQLQIDLDNDNAYQEHLRRYDQMTGDERSIFSHKHDYVEKYSASGYPHRHVTLTFPTASLAGTDFRDGFKESERILLQAALNDDPLRVYLNTRRLVNGIPNPTRFFEKPQLHYKTADGLLYHKDEPDPANFLSASAGDAIAIGYGFMYVERLVKWLEEHQYAEVPEPEESPAF